MREFAKIFAHVFAGYLIGVVLTTYNPIFPGPKCPCPPADNCPCCPSETVNPCPQIKGGGKGCIMLPPQPSQE